MKRTLKSIFACALILCVGMVGAATVSAFGRNYSDENGDGVCDNCTVYSGCAERGFCGNPCGSFESGTFFRNGSGRRVMWEENVNTSNFVDENGDGICDNILYGCRRNRCFRNISEK
jgi:hypothetical protein